jgi:hypothetical protein
MEVQGRERQDRCVAFLLRRHHLFGQRGQVGVIRFGGRVNYAA